MILIDVLDKNGKPTGESKAKREIHEQGLWHNAAHVWIYNSNGEILLQLRAKDKDSYPGLWDISVAGHTDSGETPVESAVREMREEIGLFVNSGDLMPGGTVKISQPIADVGWYENERGYIYFYKFDGDINMLSMPDGEVEKLEFISVDKFESEINNPKTNKKYVTYIPNGEYYKMIINKIRMILSIDGSDLG